METTTAPSLIERLHRCATLWTDAHQAAPGRIGRLVVNDAGVLPRISQPGASVTTTTLEKFAAFLADAANWPGGVVPQEALDLAHVVGVTLPCTGLSSGNDAEVSRQACGAAR
jgi:hypothetical protein